MFDNLLTKTSSSRFGAERKWRRTLLGLAIVAGLAFLFGCAGEDLPTPTPSRVIPTEPVPTPQPRQLPSLVPTFTTVPTPTPPPVPTDAIPAVSGEQPSPTPASFDEIVVDLRYRIPALGLDRRLVGNMANRITLLDAANGQQVELSNQGGVMLELRQGLSEAELAAIPAGCDGCVALDYELSIEEQAASGWLQDAVLLASVEHFMAAGLGPHFPPDTVVGLRRSASPYAPAHTIAMSSDGQLWAWLATDSEVSEPTVTITETMPLQAALDEFTTAAIEGNYVVDCTGSPVETLFLDLDGEAISTVIVCPEFSLPSTLLPLYLALDALVEPVVADARLPRPPAAFPLDALLDYRRGDGSRLTLFQGGRMVALDAAATVYTSTLATTQVLSLTTGLLQSGELTRGLSTFIDRPTVTITPTATVSVPTTTSVLVLRAPDGLHEGEWGDTSIIAALADLNALLNELIGLPEPSPEGTAEPEPTDEVGNVDVTTTPVVTAVATPTP